MPLDPTTGLPIVMTLEEYAIAREKGRRKAVEVLLVNEAKREELEEKYGLEYCMRRYPEVYGINAPPRFE